MLTVQAVSVAFFFCNNGFASIVDESGEQTVRIRFEKNAAGMQVFQLVTSPSKWCVCYLLVVSNPTYMQNLSLHVTSTANSFLQRTTQGQASEMLSAAIKKSNSTSSCVNHLVAVSEGVLCRVRYPVEACVQSRWRAGPVSSHLAAFNADVYRVHMLILAARRYVSAQQLAGLSKNEACGCVYEGNVMGQSFLFLEF